MVYLPFESPRDLNAIEEALRSIIDTIHPHAIVASLQGRITEFKELLDHLDLYVEMEENYPEYRKILLGRIAAKNTEVLLRALSDHQQELGVYIAEQKAGKNMANVFDLF